MIIKKNGYHVKLCRSIYFKVNMIYSQSTFDYISSTRVPLEVDVFLNLSFYPIFFHQTPSQPFSFIEIEISLFNEFIRITIFLLAHKIWVGFSLELLRQVNIYVYGKFFLELTKFLKGFSTYGMLISSLFLEQWSTCRPLLTTSVHPSHFSCCKIIWLKSNIFWMDVSDEQGFNIGKQCNFGLNKFCE
jgi:hypothetical protein